MNLDIRIAHLPREDDLLYSPCNNYHRPAGSRANPRSRSLALADGGRGLVQQLPSWYFLNLGRHCTPGDSTGLPAITYFLPRSHPLGRGPRNANGIGQAAWYHGESNSQSGTVSRPDHPISRGSPSSVTIASPKFSLANQRCSGPRGWCGGAQLSRRATNPASPVSNDAGAARGQYRVHPASRILRM